MSKFLGILSTAERFSGHVEIFASCIIAVMLTFGRLYMEGESYYPLLLGSRCCCNTKELGERASLHLPWPDEALQKDQKFRNTFGYDHLPPWAAFAWLPSPTHSPITSLWPLTGFSPARFSNHIVITWRVLKFSSGDSFHFCSLLGECWTFPSQVWESAVHCK